MKILFITHADFEKPGCIETWANKNAHVTQVVKPYKGEKLPDLPAFDFLVVMGGPQSALKLAEAPYLNAEIELIKQAIQQKKRIIGVCLGAQLIGEALGAKTEPSPYREIGAFNIELTSAGKSDPVFKFFPAKFDVMHWHSDMPGLSAKAVLLATSEGCPRQVVRYDERIYGFQCHFELTKELVGEMIENCRNDLKADKYVRTIDELLTTDYSKINTKMNAILDYLANLPDL